MSIPESPSSSRWLAELEAILQQLQDETIRFALVGMAVGALAILGSTSLFTNAYWNFWMLVGLIGLIAGVWSIRRRSLILACWLLVLGSLVAIILTVMQNVLWPVLWMVMLPVGLATLMLGCGTGVALAAACTLLLWLAPSNLSQVPPLVRAITAIGMWSTVGMIWLTLRPLTRAVAWAWSGYERNREMMEQMRDTQMRLQETLEDLTNANILLTRMTQQAEAMRQVAEVERQAKERFVANVSHELRTPLNMIIGFCEMITQEPDNYGGDIPPALLADLSVVLRNSQHLSSLINDVLDLSQLDAGRTALSRERTSLAEIIEAAVVAVRPLYDSKALFLKTLVAEDLPLVFCDRTRIREVVLNLLSNAGRFTAQGGVTVRAWQEGEEVVVSVEDSGPGITKENQEKLFQPFQQLESSIRRDFGGTGLGLSISKGFVELHGGQMKVESQVGLGTTFFFRLPVDPPVAMTPGALRWFGPYQTYEPRTRPTRLAPVTIRPRLVVIEKGNAVENLLCRYMRDVEIAAVEDLDQAGAELERAPAQALLLNDLQVSDAFARLAGFHLPAGIPAIICSLPGVEQATGSLGVADYLLKPVSQETLYAAIDRLNRPVKTVLVVDNEPDALQLFARMLTAGGRDAESRGYTVLRVSNGHEALDLLQHQLPDLILCDLMMPEMDGFQFLAQKGQNPAWQDIPVILVSARDPLGQPIVSNALLVTSKDGLSVSQLLSSIEALISILSSAPSGHPGQPVASPG